MTLDEELDRQTIRERMKSINRYLPCEKAYVYDFCHYYADNLPQHLSPAIFVSRAASLLKNLIGEMDGQIDHPKGRNLIGIENIHYIEIMMRIPDIAYELFSETFSRKVTEYYNTIIRTKE